MKRIQPVASRLPDQLNHRQISRRSFMQTMTVLGVAGLNAYRAAPPLLAQPNRSLSVAFQSWIADLHPGIVDVNAAFPDLLYQAGTPRFSDAQNGSSPWDVYVGITPFVDMEALIAADIIEPWDEYIPQEVLDDIIPAVREEGTLDGKLYSWPFLVDIVVQSYNANIITEAGLPHTPPATWNEYLSNAATIVSSGAAPFGCTFDPHGWRSLAAIAHSISTDVYYILEGDTIPLFDFTHPAAVQALQIMRQMVEQSLTMSVPDDSLPVSTDRDLFESQSVGYYITYQNAPLRFSVGWDDRSALRLAALPSGGDGATVFWTTGACLFKYGQNKAAAAEYMRALTYDNSIWLNSIVGNETSHSGQPPPYQSFYTTWQQNPPEWLADNAWVDLVRQQLDVAKAIPNHAFGLRQFIIGKPYWEAYLRGIEPDPTAAMQAAKDAVVAEIQRTNS